MLHICVRILCVATAVFAAGIDLSAQAQKPGTMQVTLSGISTFSGPLAVSCRKDDFEAGVMQIEGRSAEVLVRFSLYGVRKGTHKIVMEGLTPTTPAYVRFDVLTIAKQPYTVPAGEATLTDDAGRSGSLKAARFIKNGAGLSPIELTLQAAWACP